MRALHDGPAQSIANIGLQTEVVERLFDRGDARAPEEMAALRRLVQSALDTTKEFIFEVRPMVLDHLGLGPTVRRACADRSKRTGVRVDFDSQGNEQRLPSDLESAVFRSIDQAVAGYVELKPPAVTVALDWSGRELRAKIGGRWPHEDGASTEIASSTARPGETPAYLLAMMEEKRSEEREARSALRALPPAQLAELTSRATAMGMRVNVLYDGRLVELLAPIPR